MTSLELDELIEQELVANPVLEEVQPGDEVQEISDNILDQNANGVDEGFANGSDPEGTFSANNPGDFLPEVSPIILTAHPIMDSTKKPRLILKRAMIPHRKDPIHSKRSIMDGNFRITSIPATGLRKSNTRTTPRVSSNSCRIRLR